MKTSDHAIKFLEQLTLVGDYSGEPLKLLPFQRDIIKQLFRTVRGKRQVRRAFLMLPRKQAKTTLAAAIVVFWLLGLGRTGQQILSVANDQEQAAHVFKAACQMIEADPYLSSLCTITPTTKRIAVNAKYSFYAALSKESKTKTGWSPSLVIVDEFQDITDPEMVKNLTSGFGARTDYLTLFICTAGTRKNTPCYAEYEYARKWISGEIVNPQYAAWIYEAPEEADWTSEETWKAAMPAYGRFCNPEVIRSKYELARMLPHIESEFRQYYLNQWQVGDGSKWLRDSDWMANSAPPLGDAEFYTAGLDLASVQDTSSLVLLGRNSQGKFDVIPFVWVCEDQIRRRQTAEFDYLRWKEAGYLRTTPGNAQDQEQIMAELTGIFARYKVKTLALDKFGTQWFGPKLQERGIPAFAFGQSFGEMSQPLKEIEKLVLAGELAHGGHPVLRWMCGNCRLKKDDFENYRISKAGSEEKVDGMVALAMAAGVYPFNQPPNILDNRDLLFSLLPRKKTTAAAK